MRLSRPILSLLAMAAASGCATTRQPPLQPPGISHEEKVVLGGLEQTIYTRGRDRANPVLLFLHGGPGLPEMPFSHVNAELERDFTVVHWDQRGAGKSYRPDIPLDSMTTAELLRETEELVRHLRARLGKKKVFLAGYSWGSFLGAQEVARHPEWYHAYIGISQVVDLPQSELWLHRGAIAQAEASGQQGIAAKLRRIGEPPYQTRKDERLVNQLSKALQPKLPVTMSRGRYLRLGLASSYYSLADDVRLIRGFSFSGHALEADIWSQNLLHDVPEIAVPVYLFVGRYDTVVSPALTVRFFRHLRAPRGKQLTWFEHSDHVLHLEETLYFQDEMHRVRREVLGPLGLEATL